MGIKQNREYYVSVEGETEKWYFEHLKKLINQCDDALFKVKMEPRVKKSPLSFVKALAAPYEIKAFHICDYESNEEEHVRQFKKMLIELKEANRIKRKIIYSLGYSNYSFDLWMILHKRQFIGPLPHRKSYLKGINDVYNEHFQFLDDYKEEANFKRILSRIDLSDVKRAIQNADYIRKKHAENGDVMDEYAGFLFYRDNPDLTINECIKQLLEECGVD